VLTYCALSELQRCPRVGDAEGAPDRARLDSAHIETDKMGNHSN